MTCPPAFPLTLEQVNALAPDAASAKAGEKLARASQWQTLGQAGATLWGEIKGSGSKPYQTAIDLTEPAFKCSCPSRKFPCKHGLGLALIYASQPEALTLTTDPAARPAWVQEWLEKRSATQQKKAEKVAAQQAGNTDGPPEDDATRQKKEKAQQKRQAAREDKINAGVEELQRWLFDIVRQGLASWNDINAPQAFETLKARMVDAQAPGLARLLDQCNLLRYDTHPRRTQGKPVPERLLEAFASLHLLLSAWQHRTSLPEAVQADLNTLIGIPQAKETVLAQPGVTDCWRILGQVQEADEADPRMLVQRLWLYGEGSGQYALLLDFAMQNAPGQHLPLYPPVTAALEGEIAYYPGSQPQRALLKDAITPLPPTGTTTALPVPPFVTMAEALQQHAAAVARLPWLTCYPLALDKVIPVCDPEQNWWLLDMSDSNSAADDTATAETTPLRRTALPLQLDSTQCWTLLAISAGQPLQCFGEWDGVMFHPLSAFAPTATADAPVLCWLNKPRRPE